jgi:hypothetical protein
MRFRQRSVRFERRAASSGVRDRGVVDEQVEAAKLLVDALCRSGDRSLISHVDLQGKSARPDLLCGRLTTFEVARSHQYSEAVRDEFLCYLQSDTLIGSGDQGNAIGSLAPIIMAHGP